MTTTGTAAPTDSAAAWQRLLAADDVAEYAAAWLALQCRQLGNAARGALYAPARTAAEPPQALATFPQHAIDDGWPDIAVAVLAQGRGIVAEPERIDGRLVVAMGCPVFHEDGSVAAAVVVELEAGDNAGITRAMELLRWGVTGLELMFVRQGRVTDRQLLARGRTALAVLGAALEAADFHGAVLAAVTRLASELGCDRAAWGVVSGLEVRIEAMSHTTQHVPGMSQLRAMVAGMEDALHATGTVDALSADTPGLRTLVQESGLAHVLSVPGHHDGAYRGVLLLERGAKPFAAEERFIVEATVALLLPMLEWRRLFAQDLRERLKRGARESWHAFWAPESTLRRYIVLGLLAVLFLLAVIPADYRVTAEVGLEGAEKRAVVAPFDGFLATAPARAGDVVAEGDVLATLDDRDLHLEQLKWVGQSAQYQGQFQQALGEHDRARTNISQAQVQQAQAELELVATKIDRTHIAAPIAGLILQGDLTQRLGSRVTQGEVLYEIAPLADYRVVLRVDERYIADVRENQPGRLVLSSLPDDTFAFTVTRVTAIATAEGGINYFRVEGRIDQPSSALRPGMEGVGKIVAGSEPLLWAWLQPVVDWLRLWFWRWMP